MESTWGLAKDRGELDTNAAEALRRLLEAESSRVIDMYDKDRAEALTRLRMVRPENPEPEDEETRELFK